MPNARKPGFVLFASGLPRMAKFYEAIVPMTLAHSEPGLIVLEAQGFELVVHGIPEHIARSISIGSPPARRTDTALKPVLPVDSIARARLQAAELGGELDAEHAEFEWRGFRCCHGHDPEGNIIQFRERLKEF